MENKIKILSEDLANKIAAGEVVERPASVVKELVENSIDAQAQKIIVEVDRGGRGLIRVIDDGIGMTEDDALTAFERHSTSKIATVEDLANIHTLGFRGEALPSIASVSQLEMVTRTADSINGTSIKIDGGTLKDVSAHPSGIGTTLSIKRLFFNTPARLKFLKSISTEMTHIIDIITQQSIAHPKVAFRLLHNNRKSLDFPRASDLKGRLRDVFGKDIWENLVEVNLEKEQIKIFGFVGKTSVSRRDRRHQYIFVNKRHIRNRVVAKAIYEGFGGALSKDRNPVFVLFIELHPDFVDVNVHPTKAEVRFSNSQMIYKSVLEAVSTSFAFGDRVDDFYSPTQITPSAPTKTYHMPKRSSAQPIKPDYTPVGRTYSSKNQRKQIAIYEDLLENHKAPEDKITTSKAMPEMELKAESPQGKKYQIIGQVHNCYIILQTEEGMMIVDQHVAHERILYEQAKNAVIENPIASQRLLFPITMELSPTEFLLIEANHDLLTNIGFDVKIFSGRTVVVETIPSTLKNWENGKIFRDILDMESDDVQGIVDDDVEKIITNYSCKSAIKKGMKMTPQEMSRLIHDWLATENPYTCPHGRPIVLNLTLQELNRKFGRSGGDN